MVIMSPAARSMIGATSDFCFEDNFGLLPGGFKPALCRNRRR